MDKKTIIKSIEKHKDAIAKHRDALRDLLEDLENIVDSCDCGVQALEGAIDDLSQYL